MINRVILVGRITKDPELRKTASNSSVVSFTVACNRRYASSQQSSNQPTADFINCVAWNQSADFLARYASKGSLVGVEGRITTRSYDGQNGRVYVTEVTCDSVQLLGSKGESRNEQVSQGQVSQPFTPSSETSFGNNNNFDDDFADTVSLDISSDDLPFY